MEWIPLTILAAALGALIGVAGTAAGRWIARKKTAAANWDALHAEIDLCHQMAVGYFQEKQRTGINLPLSRWPTTLYADCLKSIIAEREIDPTEIQPLMVLYGNVDQINLAFDEALKARDRQAEALVTSKVPHPWAKPLRFRGRRPAELMLGLELARLQLKVFHLAGTKDANDVYLPAAAIVQRHRDRFNSLRWRLLFLQLRR